MNGQGDEADCTECGRTNKSGSAFCGFCGAKLASSRIDLTDLGDESPAKDLEITLSDSPASKRVGGLVLSREIERGGMGVVYEAFDEHLERTVAVKVISPDLAGDERFRKRFIAETRAVASLNNPFILPVYQAGEEDGQLFLITKLANGGDMASALRKHGALSKEATATVISEIGEALGAAHEKGMIHRDVKPANVLIDEESGRTRYFLTDFGLTKFGMESSGITNTGEVLGTVDYMAPEQIEGGPVDQRVDVYALGCMAVELLTGNPPFRRDSKQATLIAHLNEEPAIPDLPHLGNAGGVREILARALTKDPADRYSTTTEFSRDFAAALEGEGFASEQATQAMSAPLSAPPQQKKSRVGVMAAALAALLLLAGGGGYVLAGGDGFPSNDTQSNNSGSEDTEPTPDPGPPPDEDDSGSEDTEPTPDPVPQPQEVSLEFLADDEQDKIASNELEIYTAAGWAGDGDLPQIGSEPQREAVVFEGWDLDRNQVEAQLPLAGYSSFSALAGAESNMPKQRVVRLEIQVTGSDGLRRTEWEKNLRTGASASKVDIDLKPGDSQLIFLINGESYVKEDKYDSYRDYDSVVIAEGKLTKTQAK